MKTLEVLPSQPLVNVCAAIATSVNLVTTAISSELAVAALQVQPAEMVLRALTVLERIVRGCRN